MQSIIRQLGERVLGVLSGFDRLLFRGFLRCVVNPRGLNGYLYENCIYHADDLDAAQRLLDTQLNVSWTTLLGDLVRQVHPAHESIFTNCPTHARNYYGTVAESEWASDILFHDPADVLPLCERLAAYSMSVHGPGDVMRFFGRTVRADGQPRASFQGTIQSNVRRFEEGLRLKHWMNGNSEKMYNKPGTTALRLEATINNPEEFKAFRIPENASPDAKMEWLPVRKGVADLYRRAQVSQAANDRFAAAQAAVLNEDAVPLKELVASLCRRVVRPGREKSDGSRVRPRTFRALNPLSPEDVHLLTLVSQPKFGISGMRNQDLRPALYRDPPTNPKEQRRQASTVSRKLSLLRAHGILEKVQKSHRYRLTEKGKQGLTALLAAANAATSKLTSLAGWTKCPPLR